MRSLPFVYIYYITTVYFAQTYVGIVVEPHPLYPLPLDKEHIVNTTVG